MSKSRKTRKRISKTTPAAAPGLARRDMLKLARNGAIGAVLVSGGGYFALGSFQAYAAEHDLTRLGQGKPVVVQVHDPQCPTCTALQKQARRALKSFGECDLVYLIADITTPEGRAFAVRHGVGNVTLLLFDGQGGLHQTVQGLHDSNQLDAIFQAHHGAVTVS
ncbi:thioredoxin family protein [Roseobacter sp. YSTF-M11]|uniref:Thioredoxin family protein n=1 Tax=Roseobacter insulae TaxID=2859783 RepID=A0A9X1FV81_9RHOB|nr:thioredoxin family protein [Roseobacter insulae]MBW4707483.1 thioredoxin family protein [Roseobacter insulae]